MQHTFKISMTLKNGLYYYDTYDKSMNSDFFSYELVFQHEAN
jgi:hypothetical protein